MRRPLFCSLEKRSAKTRTRFILRAGAVHVTLSPRPASCKPRDRWLAQENSKAAACCGPQAATSGCCA
ncbi:hypothetical protein ACCT09_51070, partial [Rhizobium ruizarguesonis]